MADLGAPAADDPVLQLLEQVGDGDPRLRAFAQLVQARASAEAARAEATRSARDAAAEAEARLRRLREAYLELRDQYLRVAAALGACPRCWGENPRCRDCGGAGTSGFFEPDHELFRHYVVPAVRRARGHGRSASPALDVPQSQSQPEG